ncbi:hypothetical protein [Streptomyces sp. NPDC005408]
MISTRVRARIAVLQRYYAKVLDGEKARMNDLIDQGFAEHGQGSGRPIA